MNIMISVSQIYCRMLNSYSDSWKYFGAFKFVKLISSLLVTFFRFCLILFAVDFVFIAALATNFWFFVFFFVFAFVFHTLVFEFHICCCSVHISPPKCQYSICGFVFVTCLVSERNSPFVALPTLLIIPICGRLK